MENECGRCGRQPAIQIEINQIYCEECILQRIRVETEQTIALEEDFIYFKEFESAQLIEEEEEIQIQRNVEDEEKEKALQVQLQRLKLQLIQCGEEENVVEERVRRTEDIEQLFWKELNIVEGRAIKLEERLLQLKFEREEVQKGVRVLEKKSMLHRFLGFQFQDCVALIQGMTMGRRNDQQDIPWDEISVGVGHLLLAYNIIALRYDYTAKRIASLKLCGQYSQIQLRQSQRVLMLSQQKDLKQIWEVLLVQINALSQHLLSAQNRAYSQQFQLPYKLDPVNLLVVDLPIDPSKHEERSRWTTWTRAIKHFLIDFHHIVSVYSITDKFL